MQAAATQANQATDARRCPAALAIGDAIPEVVDAGADLPTADNAQALHAVSLQGIGAIPDGRGVANTAPATPPGPGTAVISAVGALFGQAAAAAACLPFGSGLGGIAISASDIRARATAARKAAERDAEATRAAHRARLEERRSEAHQ